MKSLPKLPLKVALMWIFGSAVLINGIAAVALFGFKKKKKDTAITALVQTGPEKEALRSSLLAELLDLSSDQPPLSKAYSLSKAKKKLESCPVIASAEVKLAGASSVYIDYTVRKPIALLGDFEDVAFDERGYPFPFSPFFSPKNLPEIYLGLDQTIVWNKPIEDRRLHLAFSLLELLEGPMVCDLFQVKRLDVSKAFEKSFGKREIVLVIEDEIIKKKARYLLPRFLRLNPKDYPQQLGNYLNLREKLLEAEEAKLPEGEGLITCRSKVIDLRLPQLAFIEEK